MGTFKKFKTKACHRCRTERRYKRTGTVNEKRGWKKVSQILSRMANAIYCSRAHQRSWFVCCENKFFKDDKVDNVRRHFLAYVVNLIRSFLSTVKRDQ